MITNTFAIKIKRGIDCYVKITAIAILPAFYFAILYYLAARAWSSAVFTINLQFAQKLSRMVIGVFSIYPILWLSVSIKGLVSSEKVPVFTRVLHWVFLAGIISAHVVTWLAVRAGQYEFYTFEFLIRYDLILLDIYAYWKSDRKGLEAGLKCLSVLLWLSAIYGIIELFFPGQVALFNEISLEGRVKSVYTNPIISGSVWLMGFWLPFPSHKKWARGFVRCCYVVAIIFTISKDAWIGLGISIVIYLIWNRKKIIKKTGKHQIFCISIFAGITCILGIVFFSINRSYIERILSRWNNFQRQYGFLLRLYHAQDTVHYVIHDAPFIRQLFGFGNSMSREFIKTTPHFTGITNLDNQYIISLYEFGIFGLLCLILWAAVCCWAALKGDSWQKAAGMGITAMLLPIGTYDPFTWDIITFLLLLLSVLTLTELRLDPGKTAIRKGIIKAAVVLAFVAFAFWAWPYAISWCKTLYYSLIDLNQNQENYILVGRFCFASGLLCIGVVVSILVYSVLSFQMLGKKETVITGVFLSLSFAWILWGNGRIIAEAKKLEPLLNEESELLRIVMNNAEGYVYEDQYPWIYQKQEEGLRASVFSGEAIIPGDSTTILTAGTYCSNDLLSWGYLFSYISKDHALYTDDVKLIRALEAEGMRFTSYYHNYDNYEDLSGQLKSTGYDIHRFYDPVERLVHKEYYNDKGEKEINSDGYFAVTYLYDQWGNKTEEQFYGTDGNLKINIWGYAVKKCYSNDFGQMFREEFYGLEYEPVVNNNTAFAQEYEQDLSGNIIVYRYYDKENHLVKTPGGYAILRRTYNALKQILSDRFYGVEDEPILVGGRHVTVYERDEAGNPICERFLDLNENPVLISSGYAQVRRKYDERNQVIREEFYGTEGEPVINANNVFAQEYEYDSAGNITVFHYFGEDNQPVLTTNGYATLKRTYNERHQIISESYFGMGDEPIIVNGYHSTTFERNEIGDPTCQRYYDLYENPVKVSDGYAMTIRVYNEKQQIVRQEFYGLDDERVLCTAGYFAIEYEYDDAGNQIECRFYDINDQPVISSLGYAILFQAFDEKNQLIREEYYGKDREPIERNGYHRVDYRRDSAGHVIEEFRYSVIGDPAEGTDGYAHAVRRYNENGEIEIERRYDAHGNQTF